jgi:excinuclease ABC subunit C
MDWSCLPHIPPNPGVYLFKDGAGTIIYVGMATNLHNRVRSYARVKSRDFSELAKIREINDTAAGVEFVVAESELGAKIMEDYLIYHLRPCLNSVILPIRYNYLKVTTTEKFPRLVHTKDLQDDGSAYFGPFYSFTHSKDILAEMRRLFKIRVCEYPIPVNPGQAPTGIPCPDFDLGHCLGPCRGNTITTEIASQYDINVRQLLQVLGGNIAPLEDIFARKMGKASTTLDFESAAKYKRNRDRLIQALNRRKMQLAGKEDLDLIRQQVEKFLPKSDLPS